MAGGIAMQTPRRGGHGPAARRATRDPAWVRWSVIFVSLTFLAFFLVVPLAVIFAEALGKGLDLYLKSFNDRAAQHAIKLTLTVAAIAVPLNVLFGLVASWCIAKFNFIGKSVLLTLIDLPFAVSPVISGLIFVLLFGLQGWMGLWLRDPIWMTPNLDWVGFTGHWFPVALHWVDGAKIHLPWLSWAGFAGSAWPFDFQWWHPSNIKVIFAVPGIVLATIFVTFPFVARELIPLMQAQGTDEEEAALVLGASGLKTFWRVTLPNVKWALLYGVILCNARAMGEFGAVSVVSGHISNKTNTLPLHIELLYNSNKTVAAFAMASLLAILALVTLVVKAIVERRAHASAKSLGAEDE